MVPILLLVHELGPSTSRNSPQERLCAEAEEWNSTQLIHRNRTSTDDIIQIWVTRHTKRHVLYTCKKYYLKPSCSLQVLDSAHVLLDMSGNIHYMAYGEQIVYPMTAYVPVQDGYAVCAVCIFLCNCSTISFSSQTNMAQNVHFTNQ